MPSNTTPAVASISYNSAGADQKRSNKGGLGFDSTGVPAGPISGFGAGPEKNPHPNKLVEHNKQIVTTKMNRPNIFK
ncbi:hypothetical protein [Methylomusa anaerophila]|uniref:hypothetical protein n=1 Tax=Methylomusa anaerophila TaxID=1930071 RepID=UPI001E45B683|nr:hypothetical protein [Methylomusa anaerophila]